MTTPASTQIERALREATQWTGEEQNLWVAALESRRNQRFKFSTIPSFLLLMSGPRLVAATVVVCVIGAIILTTFQSTNHRLGKDMRMASPPASVVDPWSTAAPMEAAELWDSLPASRGQAQRTARGMETNLGNSRMNEVEPSIGPMVLTNPPSMYERSVIRKVTMDLRCNDVHATFRRIMLLISEARGEYVQESKITGEDERIHGMLTLRVSADRVSDLLNQLRELGTVVDESQVGEDVTAQVVDLEARLANERRIEAELLELLESRQDAPLEDILQLRDAIGNCRESIELMLAQQKHLQHMVALATIFVNLRPVLEEQSESVLEEQMGLVEYFGTVIRNAWDVATRGLADSIAWFVRVFVAGLIWWLLAIGLIIYARQVARKRIVMGNV